MKTRARWLYFIFFVAAGILAIYYFSEIKNEFKLLKKVNPFWLAAALCSQFMTYYFAALIYLDLLKPYRLPRSPGVGHLLRAAIISLFFNQAVPSAGISGNTYIFNFLSRYNFSRTQVIEVILGELLIYYAAMESVILALFFISMLFYRSLVAFKSTLAAGMLVYLGFGLIILFAGKKGLVTRLFEKIMKMQREEVRLPALLHNSGRSLARIFIFQLLVVAADAATLYALFMGLGYPVAPFLVIITLVSTRIITLVPFLPGGLILYEGSMSLFFTNAGIPAGTAVVVTLVYRLLSFWLPMPAGAILYRQWRKEPAATPAQ